jgi:hypothetical protein
MSAPTWFRTLQTRGLTIWWEGERVRCRAPHGVLTTADRQRLALHRTDLRTWLREHSVPAPDVPQPPAPWPHQTPWPPEPALGPLRQGQQCPRVWYVPCPCGAVHWQWVACTETWRCGVCDTWYGQPVCQHPQVIVHGPRRLCQERTCGRMVFAACPQCGGQDWQRAATSNAHWTCTQCQTVWSEDEASRTHHSHEAESSSTSAQPLLGSPRGSAP